MRYTIRIRLKVSQREHMAELQIDRIVLQRDILVRQNESDGTEVEKMEFNRRLIASIDDRWGSSREEDADATKKPLIGYAEWRVIESRYAEEARNRSHLGEQRSEEDMDRWTNWKNKPTLEQWKWSAEIGLYPRRRPVLHSTEELGGGRKRKKKGYQIVANEQMGEI